MQTDTCSVSFENTTQSSMPLSIIITFIPISFITPHEEGERGVRKQGGLFNFDMYNEAKIIMFGTKQKWKETLTEITEEENTMFCILCLCFSQRLSG